MKRVLITGANSYVGTNVERWLMKEPDKYYVETLDMKDPNWINFDFSKFDVVFHVAGIAHIKETKKNRDLFYKVNRDLAVETAIKAKESGVKQFIFLSSMSVYGIESGIITKDAIPKPKSSYGKSKLEAENLLDKLKSNKFIVTILRPPMIYGFKSPGNYIKLSNLSLKLPFYPKIDNRRSMLFIDNLSIHINKYIEKEMGGLFFPQNKEYVNTSSLISTIRQINGRVIRECIFLNPIIFFLKIISKSMKKLYNNLTYEIEGDSINELVEFRDSVTISELGYKKRVLMLSNDAKYTYDFRKEIISSLIDNGYDVMIVTPNHDYAEKIIKLGAMFKPINYRRHGKNPIEDYQLYKNYIRLIKEFKPNIVLTYTIKPNIYGGLAAEKLNVPYIANITGLGTAVERKSLLQKITTMLYKKAFKNVNTVFFQNQENMDYFIKQKIALGKHELIPGSGVNLEHFKLMTYPSDEIIRFVFIGRIMKEKGIEYYLEAARVLKKKYDNLEFHVCGFLEENYKDLINELVSDNTIIYHGLIDDVRLILKDMHAIIHPTYYPEGISNVLLEASAMGRPAIATNRSGCKEVIDHGITGYLFEAKNQNQLNNQVENFINTSNEINMIMGLKAREKIEKEFNRTTVVNQYMYKINGL